MYAVKQFHIDVRLQAARIMVAALRAGADMDLTKVPTRIVLAPADVHMDADAASAQLAKLAKPTQCGARVDDHALSVECGAVDSSWKMVHEQAITELDRGAGVIGSIESDARMNDDGPILVVTDDEALLVSLAALKLWVRDYVVTLPLALGSQPPEEDEQRLGARYVVTMGRHESIDPESEWGRRLLELWRALRPSNGDKYER